MRASAPAPDLVREPDPLITPPIVVLAAPSTVTTLPPLVRLPARVTLPLPAVIEAGAVSERLLLMVCAAVDLLSMPPAPTAKALPEMV